MHRSSESIGTIAGALAKARGITVIEHKTPDAGAFAALLTLSGETGRGTTVVCSFPLAQAARRTAAA